MKQIASFCIDHDILMPGREECEAIRRRFLEDPAAVYRGVFTLLTGDKLENGETKDKE